jgi:sugar-phosphatase
MSPLSKANKTLFIDCDAILFDLDGVLIDSTRCIERHWQEWSQKHHIDINKIMANAHGVRTIETIQKVAPHLDGEKEAACFTAHEILDTEGVVAIAGAKSLMSQLPTDQWAIVTSGGYKLVLARLIRAGLPIPKFVVSADDVAHGKPSPEPYLTAAKKLGLAPEYCIVVEDAPIGVKSGKAAGMRVIGITSTHSINELIGAEANFIVECLGNIDIHTDEGNSGLKIELSDSSFQAKTK